MQLRLSKKTSGHEQVSSVIDTLRSVARCRDCGRTQSTSRESGAVSQRPGTRHSPITFESGGLRIQREGRALSRPPRCVTPAVNARLSRAERVPRRPRVSWSLSPRESRYLFASGQVRPDRGESSDPDVPVASHQLPLLLWGTSGDPFTANYFVMRNVRSEQWGQSLLAGDVGRVGRRLIHAKTQSWNGCHKMSDHDCARAG